MRKSTLIPLFIFVLVVTCTTIGFCLLSIISAYTPLEWVEAKAATCTSNGNISYYRNTKNGLLYEDGDGEIRLREKDVIIPALKHTIQYKDAQRATCTEMGTKEHWECSNCGRKFSDEGGNIEITDKEIDISPLGHSFKTTITEPTIENATGYTTYTCNVCEYSYREDSIETFGLTYILSADEKEYYVSSCDLQKKMIVQIPKKYKDKPVTAINFGAFKDSKYIQGVIMPDSLKVIGDEAFYGCSNLVTLTMANNVEVIGKCAFYGCCGLKSISISESVSSIGYNAFGECLNIENATMPTRAISAICKTELKFVTIIGGDKIDDAAFKGCGKLKEITISDSVTTISEGALSGCGNLESITLPFVGSSKNVAKNEYRYPLGYIFGCEIYNGGAEADQLCIKAEFADLLDQMSMENIGKFANPGQNYLSDKKYYIPLSLKKVTITGGKLLAGAFKECSNIKEVIIGSNVETISFGWLAGCTNLKDVSIDNNNKKFHISNSCIIETQSKKLISGLSNCSMPNDGSVRTIGVGAFACCTNLTNISIPESVTSIGDGAFSGCTNLTNISIPESVTSIGDQAFAYCESLINISIPDSVSTIGAGVFYSCTNLTNVKLSNNITSLDAFYMTYYLDGEHWGCLPYGFFAGCSLKSIIIPNSVTSIGDWAFVGCDSLTSIEIPDSVKSIGYDAFRGCSSLTNIEIPSSVTSIGDRVFSDCSSLTSIEISNSVESIGDYAFYNCSSLTNIEIPSSVTSIGDYAFRGCSSLKDIRYAGTIAEWTDIKSDSYWASGITIHCTDGDITV